MYWWSVLCIVAVANSAAIPPKNREPELTEEQKKEELKDEPKILQDWELSLEYGRYLKEVVQALESDHTFRKKLEDADAKDIKSGKIARELNFVDHNIRNKLDELKRRELERLRHYAIQEQEKTSGLDRSKLKIPVHIDHKNPTRFEVDDLRKLIQQTTQDLEQVDQQRKKDFSQYEMQKEFEYEQDLAKLSPDERKKFEEKHNQEIKKHKDHPKLHHPGSKQQLEEVWEEQDHMNKVDFDPNSFFHLHDLDGNGLWDENEVKALFLKELDKMYDPNASEDDLTERQEEMERMREHIFKEADIDRNDLISYEEFLAQTRRNEYEQDEGWQGLDEQEMYSQQEYEQYQQQRMLELQQAGIEIPHNAVLLPEHGVPLPHPADMPQYQGYQHDPMGQLHPGQVPMGQMHPNQVPMGQAHPNQVPMGQAHPNQVPMGQVHPNQVPMGQIHPNQVPMGQVHPNQLPMGQIHPNDLPMGQMQPNQVPMGQMHPNQVPMGQMHPNQVPMGQIHPNQVSMGHPGQVGPLPVQPIAQMPQNPETLPIAGHDAGAAPPQFQQQQQQQIPQQQVPRQQQVPQQQVPQQQQVPKQQIPQQQQVPQQQQQVPQQQVPQQQQVPKQQVPQQQQQVSQKQEVPQQQQQVPQQQQQVPQQQQQVSQKQEVPQQPAH